MTAPQADDADVVSTALAKLAHREYLAVRRHVLAEEADKRRERRAGRVVETPEMAAGAVRVVRALGKRAADDVDALPELAKLQTVVREELARAAAGAVAAGWSWADVGRVLGITRQVAHKRFSAALDGQGTTGAGEEA